MPHYQAFSNFTAQGRSVASLMRMYAMLEMDKPPVLPLEPVVVFLAFSIESYLNSIGARVIPFWDDIERLPWRSKVSVLHTQAGREADWGKDPLQFASQVFQLRDKLAHGKPETVYGPILPANAVPERMKHGDDLQPEWYKSINPEWVLQAKERFHVLMKYLGSLYGFDESDHLHSSSGGVLVHEGAPRQLDDGKSI